VDVRKWTLARKRPKKYGEKVETTLAGEISVRNIERRIVDTVSSGDT
jgi:hypothetical protein